MSTIAKLLTIAFSLYALLAIVFLISENRRPQATLAWALAFFFMPGLGLLIYILFGRDWKAFSKQRKLLLQDLEANAQPLLSPMITDQDRVIGRLEAKGHSHRKLMMLVRRNSRSVVTHGTPLKSCKTPRPSIPALADLQARRTRSTSNTSYGAQMTLPNRSKQFSLQKRARALRCDCCMIRSVREPI